MTDPVLDLVAMTASPPDAELENRSLGEHRDRLLEQILSDATSAGSLRMGVRLPRRRRSSRTVTFAVAAAVVAIVVATAALVLQAAVSPPVAKAAGVHFAARGGYIDATIDDPSAPAASMQAAFAEAGLDINVTVDPSSPSLAGTITFMDIPATDWTPIYGPEGSCSLPGGGTRCVIGMQVPADFSGHASIVVNGTPPAGQLYNSTNDAFAPGEALHCSGIRGMTVAQAVPILETLGQTPYWQTPDGGNDVSASSIEEQFVSDATARSLGTVYVQVQSDPPSPSAYLDGLDRDC